MSSWKSKALIILAMVVLFNYLARVLAAKNYLQVGKSGVAVEVRDTEEGRSQGLSGREKLAEDEGMLFVFDQPGIYGFWMKGMKFPLDFIWIKDNAVAEITENVAVSRMDIRPKEAVDKVLEVNSGWVKQNNVRVGDKIKL